MSRFNFKEGAAQNLRELSQSIVDLYGGEQHWWIPPKWVEDLNTWVDAVDEIAILLKEELPHFGYPK